MAAFNNGTESCPLPAFAAEAKTSGRTVLAHWPGMPGWHMAVWAGPDGASPHWCLEGRWTPGSGPDAFMGMPAEPGAVEHGDGDARIAATLSN